MQAEKSSSIKKEDEKKDNRKKDDEKEDNKKIDDQKDDEQTDDEENFLMSPEKSRSAIKSFPGSYKSRSPSRSNLLHITKKMFRKLSPSPSDKRKAEKEERKLEEKKEKEGATPKKKCPEYKKDRQKDYSYSKYKNERSSSSSDDDIKVIKSKEQKVKPEKVYGWDNITYDPQAPSTSSCHPDVDESGNNSQKKSKPSSNVDNTDSENVKKD